MPLNFDIYAGMLQHPQPIQDWSTQAYKVQQLRNAELQNQMGQEDYQARQRANQDEAAVRAVFQEADGDPVKAVGLLRQRGYHAPASAIEKQMLGNRESMAKISKEEWDNESKKIKALHSDVSSLALRDNLTHADFAQVLKDNLASGRINPQMAEQALGQVMNTPPQGLKGLATQFAYKANEAKEQLDALMPKTLDTGARILQTSKLTGQEIPGLAPVAKEMAPGKAEEIKQAERHQKVLESQGWAKIALDKEEMALKKAGAKAKSPDQQAATAEADNAIATIDSIAKHPGFKNAVGLGIPYASNVPGTDAADFAAQVDTLKSQVFLNQIQKMKGYGQLSNAEGMKVEQGIASLSLSQSEKQFKQNLEKIRFHMERLKAFASREGGAPAAQPTAAQEVTATGPNGEKIVLRNGRWERM